MGDMGDMYRDMKEDSRTHRAFNREQSAILLKENGIYFVKKNMGAHLITEGH